MKVVVQKFGGSSVATPERMRGCAERVAEAKARGYGVVVVVSAMGDTTDDLLELAGKVSNRPAKREMDQLLATGEQVSIALMAMTLDAAGIEAVSLTGGQCGIRTEAAHSRARITAIDPVRLERELRRGRVPVVAGFQGVTEDGETTTLGRGGSDTTAVALAAAVGADVCEIYTDVDGVYTADPRIVPDARPMDRIGYDEMLEAASQGAQVMHLRAVELGKKAGVPIRVLHSQRPGGGAGDTGTLITTVGPMEQRLIAAVALKSNIGRVTIAGLPSRAGVQREIFGPIAEAGISVDDIIQNEFETGRCNLAFTVDKTDLEEVRPIVEAAVAAIGSGEVTVDTGLVKVSAVGVGMVSSPGVAARMFQALSDAGIKITNITTSEIKISCLVAEPDGKRGVRAVHEAFGLGGEPSVVVAGQRAGAGHKAG